MMANKLKYQELIDNQELSTVCPYETCSPAKGEAFRWVFEPINHELNFLPNFLFDEKTGFLRRINSLEDNQKCSNCAVSLFDSKEHARKKFRKIPEPIRSSLGYTHVAKGMIDDLGLMTKPERRYGHFELFEYEGSDLKSNFTIDDTLLS